jgi:hypothetical protein
MKELLQQSSKPVLSKFVVSFAPSEATLPLYSPAPIFVPGSEESTKFFEAEFF